MFEYAVVKWIGSYAAAMGGVDALVFTAGIGENNWSLRENVVERLGFLGFELDKEKNKVRGREADVSKDGARARILVIPTNEEYVIAKDTERIAMSLKALNSPLTTALPVVLFYRRIRFYLCNARDSLYVTLSRAY